MNLVQWYSLVGLGVACSHSDYSRVVPRWYVDDSPHLAMGRLRAHMVNRQGWGKRSTFVCTW